MGKIIAVEGIDGSGKGTQSNLLCERLINNGLTCELISFPQYEKNFFGQEVGKYLNGEFGDIDTVDPHFASILYAGDRFESLERIGELISKSDFVICDRYTPSNIAHQSAKVSKSKRPQFQKWISKLEYGVFGLPEPDAVILLDMDPIFSMRLVKKKQKRNYTNKSHDIHEENFEYLTRVRNTYLQLSEQTNWVTVSCLNGKSLRNIEDIQGEIWHEILSKFPSGFLN